MKPTTVAILLVVLLIAIVVLLSPQFITPSGGPRHDDSADTQVIPDEILNAPIDRIRIKSGRDTVELVQKNGRWWVDKPHNFLANTVPIDELLTTLGEIKGTPIEDEVSDEDEFISIDTSQTILIESKFSAIHVYLWNRLGAGRTHIGVSGLSGDNTIESYNVNSKLHDWLDDLAPHDFLAKTIDPLLMPDVTRIEIDSNQETSILEQSDGRWWIGSESSREPALEHGLLPNPGVSDYFSLLNSIEIIEHRRYIDRFDALARFGLDRPLITARFVMHDEEQDWLLRVGVPADPEDQTRFVSYCRLDDDYPAVFTVATPIALAFGQQATNFRDPRIMVTPVTLVESIALKLPDSTAQAITLPASEPPQWTIQDEAPRTLSGELVVGMLKQMADARATAYVPTKLGEWKALVSVLVTPRLGGEPEPFTIYPDPESDPAEPTVLVHRGKEPVALRMPHSAVEGLLDPGSLMAENGE